MPSENSNQTRRQWLKVSGATVGGSLLAGCLGNGNGNGNGNGDDVVNWTTGGSQEGSPVNSWIEGIATVVSQNSDVLNISPELSPGWQRNVVLISEGDIESAVSWTHFINQSQNNENYWAEGAEIGPLDNDVVMMLPSLHHGQWFFATYDDNDDIETVEDLDGSRVALNLRGESPTEWAATVMEAADIDVDIDYMDFNDAGNAFRNRTVDAAIFLATNGYALPPPTIEAFADVDWKAIDIPEHVQEEAIDRRPVMNFGTVDNDDLSEPGEFDSVTSMFQISTVGVHEDADEELVYEYVSKALDNQEDLDQYNPVLEDFGIGEGRNGFEGQIDGTKIHEGALRYYDENDVDYPEQP